MGVFAYLIIPDGTPNSDRQIVEIQAMKPGFKMMFIRVMKNVHDRPNIVSRMIYGKRDDYDYIPINNYFFKNDSLYATKYIDEDVSEPLTISKKMAAVTDPIVTKTFWLGTDRFGRDIMSRLVLGIRVSMAVGLITVLISLTLGILLGSLAGYYSGRIDDMIMWLINVIWSIPTLLLVFGITLALGKGFWQIFIAVGLTMWVNVARVIRGQVLYIKKLEYIDAAKVLGFSDMRIIFRHILPNIIGPVIVIAASNFASAIIIEAGLSFLGLGVQPPQPSWGSMIKDHYNFIITHNPALALAPGVAIMIIVLAFNLLGNGLRDAFDVR
ncbi:MAG: hypothetical protein NVS3B19_07940 [Ginsengibacter sp.]